AYVLDDGLSVADKSQIAGSLPENVHIEWRHPGPTLTGFPVWGRMSLTTYQKLLLDEWLPRDLKRVIWLDCDLLVLADIAPLWNSTGGHILLAGADPPVAHAS